MPEIPLSALDARQQKLVENAQVALARGNIDYVVTVCEPILKAVPACLPVRRLLRTAQLARHHDKNFLVKKLGGVRSRVSLILSGQATGPERLRERADQLLNSDPTSLSALKLLARAAGQLGWLETTVFAREAVRELAPHDEANLIALGEALLTVDRPADALRIADDILRRRPMDGEAQNLMRKASISQTVTKGNWEKAGDYREKLKNDPKADSLT